MSSSSPSRFRLSVCMGLLGLLGLGGVGCERAQESGPGAVQTGGSVAYQRVMEELQPGGLSLRFSDLQQAGIVGLAQMIDEILATIPAEELDLPPDFRLQTVIEETGLAGVHASGSSRIERESGRTDWRMFAWTPDGRDGLLSMFGDGASTFRSLDHAPADTDLVLEFELDYRQIAERALGMVGRFGGPEAAAEMDAELDAPNLPDGSTLRELLPKLQMRAWLVGRIDPEQVVQTEEGFSIPAMDAVLVLEDAGWLWKLLAEEVDAAVAEGMAPFERSEVDGAIEYAASDALMPPPLDFQPVLRVEQDGQRVLLATRAAYLTEVRAAPDALRGHSGYAISADGLPEQGNVLSYTSPRLLKFLTDAFATAMKENATGEEADIAMKVFSILLKSANDEGGALFMLSNLEDGMLLASSSPFSSPLASMESVTTIAVLASFAVPVFNKVTARAQQSKALNEARMLVLGLRLYAQANNGLFPDTLEELVESGDVEAWMIEGFMVGNRTVPWLYRPGLNDSSPGDLSVLMLAEPVGDGWLIGHVDGSVHVLLYADPVELGFPAPAGQFDF